MPPNPITDAVLTARSLKALRERQEESGDVPQTVLDYLQERLIDQVIRLEERDAS